MIAKLIAHGPTRAEALARLADALAETEVGGVTTNLPFLRWLVAHPVIRAGEATTAFLTEHPPLSEPPLRLPDAPGAAAGGSTSRRRRPAPAPDVDSAAHDRAAGPRQRQRDRTDARHGDRVDVAPGDRVEARRPLLVLEAMKMETPLTAPYDATVKAVHVEAGRPRRRRRPPRRAGSGPVGRGGRCFRPRSRSGARKIAVSASSSAAAIRIVSSRRHSLASPPSQRRSRTCTRGRCGAR